MPETTIKRVTKPFTHQVTNKWDLVGHRGGNSFSAVFASRHWRRLLG